MCHTARVLSVFVLVVLASGDLVAQSQSDIRVRDNMTPEEFRAAGLEKLDAVELSILDAWFAKVAVQIRQLSSEGQVGRRGRVTPSQPLDFSSLEGASVVAEDGTFLGTITLNRVDAKSLLNEVGRYGSEVSRTSIFNEVGRYGGEVARLSPFNAVTSTPPRIYKGERFIAYLSVNDVKRPRIDPRALMAWLRANE
jgi:hypothetical protein